jgi:hypothetical protein
LGEEFGIADYSDLYGNHATANWGNRHCAKGYTFHRILYGPYRLKPGFGSLVEGMSGFASKNGFADRPPVRPPLALADMIAGLYGASAVLVALREIEQRGGQALVLPCDVEQPASIDQMFLCG